MEKKRRICEVVESEFVIRIRFVQQANWSIIIRSLRFVSEINEKKRKKNCSQQKHKYHITRDNEGDS